MWRDGLQPGCHAMVLSVCTNLTELYKLKKIPEEGETPLKWIQLWNQYLWEQRLAYCASWCVMEAVVDLSTRLNQADENWVLSPLPSPRPIKLCSEWQIQNQTTQITNSTSHLGRPLPEDRKLMELPRRWKRSIKIQHNCTNDIKSSDNNQRWQLSKGIFFYKALMNMILCS